MIILPVNGAAVCSVEQEVTSLKESHQKNSLSKKTVSSDGDAVI